MLKKLTPGVNFINVIYTNFAYECCLDSFFSSYVYVEKAAETMFVQKICSYNVDEIDGRRKREGVIGARMWIHILFGIKVSNARFITPIHKLATFIE